MNADNPFHALGLSEQLHSGLDALGYRQLTPVQAATLPLMLAGGDLIALAPTGSGKTAAFGLALLQAVDPTLGHTQALVLCPTRELADQVGRQLRLLATGVANLKLSVLTGGISSAPQLASLQAQAPQVVVGTPGRVQDLLRQQALRLSRASVLVLDEADRMLDMGFEAAIRDIARRLPAQRRSWLFSATFNDAARVIASELLRSPQEVRIGEELAPPSIEQWFCEVDPAQRAKALAGLLLQHRPEAAMVFCNTRRDVDELCQSLQHYGFSALALHGELEQRDRDEVLVRFANRSCNVLVASDIAARGLDVEAVDAVFNFELPSDAAAYLHRIGRTGRAGRSGSAYSLVAPREQARAQQLERDHGVTLRWTRATPAVARPTQPPRAPMRTLRIDGGKTDKLRAGDILGALTGDAGLSAKAIGKIAIYATRSYVAVSAEAATRAEQRLSQGKIKNRSFRVRML